MAKFRRYSEGAITMHMFHCPGCEYAHGIRTAGAEPVWQFNGDLDKPTVNPSVLARGEKTCHSFIKDGQIQFLSDCDHALAGQTVELPEFD